MPFKRQNRVPDVFIFKGENVTFREELKLSDKQRFNARHFFESDYKPDIIDVLPITILVHRELAEKKFEIKRCVIITAPDPEHITVYAAPKFCCRKPFNREFLCPLYNAYVNIEKCDLNVITTSDTVIPMPPEYHKRSCYYCNKLPNEKPETHLFALSCGHFTCRTCWLEHAKWALAREFSPIPCPAQNGDCNETLTISRAAALLSDAAVAIMVEIEWRNKVRHADTLQCAGCKHFLTRNNFFRKVMAAGCACGCYTCVRCGQQDHTPLRCKDAAVWSTIRSKENEDESSSEAEKVLALTRVEFDDCLSSLKEVATEEFQKNIKFMKKHDRAHGAMLERDMPMVARMLEMRRVQQYAHKRELDTTSDTYYGAMDVNERWNELEQQFNRGLDTLGETKEKAVALDRCREHVLYYYNF